MGERGWGRGGKEGGGYEEEEEEGENEVEAKGSLGMGRE